MKCACCGRKKKLFESFENLGKGLDVCSDCSDLLYRISDAVREKNKGEYADQVKNVRKYSEKNKSTEQFVKWFDEDFLKRNSEP